MSASRPKVSRYACASQSPPAINATLSAIESVATSYQVEIVGGPGTSSYSHVRVRDVARYLTFEYLPGTAANLALTDIHAQHPNATGP